MVEKEVGIAAVVVAVAVLMSAMLTIALEVFFDLGAYSLIPLPLTIIGTILAIHQFLSNSNRSPTTYQVDQHVHMTPKTVIETPNGGRNWADMSNQEMWEMMKRDPDWRSYGDGAFELWRTIWRGVNWLAVLSLRSSHVTRQRILLFMVSVSMIGGMGTLLIFAELAGPRMPNPSYLGTIANISPLSLDLVAGIILLFPAVFLLFAPLGYLQFKSRYTCVECEKLFGLGSEGRYYRPNTDVEKTDNGKLAHGYRILRCGQCANIEIEESDWNLTD